MLITAQKNVTFETKDPKEVVAWVIKFVRENSENINSAKVKLSLISSKHEFLLHLSQFVPDDELCFNINYKSYKKTELADQLMSPAMIYSFDCELTNFLSCDKALSFIENNVLGMKPGIIRGLSFMLNVESISLKGLPEDATASLNLMDYKAWRRKHRFVCVVNLCFRATGVKDRVTREILKAVSEQTGVDFTKSKPVESFTDYAMSKPDKKQVLAVHICFNEAVEEVAHDMDKTIPDWTLVPGLKRLFDSVVGDRIKDIETGKTGKVDFNSIVKKFYNTELNNFKFDNFDGEVLWFSKEFSENIKIMAGIEKIHLFGLGKTFTLQIGLHARLSLDTRPQFLHNNFGRFLHESDELCWTYATEYELTSALHISSQVLKKVLASWEKRIKKYFTSIPNDAPGFLTRRNGSTMKAVYHEAHTKSKQISSDSELTGVYSGCNLEIRELDGGAGVDEKGKLYPHGYWTFFYQSVARDLMFCVTVPSIGSSYHLVHGSIRHYRKIPIKNLTDLLDSDEAMIITQKQLADLAEHIDVRIWDALMRLEADGPSEIWFVKNKDKYADGTPIWSVRFFGTSERGRQDISIAFDAATGKKVVYSID